MSLSPSFAAVAVAGAAVLLATTGRADAGSKQACVDAHAEGQLLRNQGKLVLARDKFLKCASTACPPLVATECAGWVAELRAILPSVIFDVTTSLGVRTTDVRVFVDGALLLTRLDGLPHELDPGDHLLRFEGADGWVHEERVSEIVGEQNRRLTIRRESRLLVPEAASRPIPALVWVGGAVTVAAGVAFTTFGLLGTSKESSLEATCGPHSCSPDDVAVAKRDYVAADVFLGLAGVAAGTAIVAFILRPEQTERTKDRPKVTASATPYGGGLTVTGAF